MINILMNTYNITNHIYITKLKNYIKSEHTVCVIPFAFREKDIPSNTIWDELYSKEYGKYRLGLESIFYKFGISSSQIEYINYYTDTPKTALTKCIHSDIIYFTGGLPDLLYKRLQDFALVDYISQYTGIIMGDSAGALIQFANYHLSPDSDYPSFSYFTGLNILRNFELEVHYTNSQIQNQSIQKVLEDKKLPVLALPDDSIIIIDNSIIYTLGSVKLFLPFFYSIYYFQTLKH